MLFNQVSPLSQQFTLQQRASDFNRAQHFSQNYSRFLSYGQNQGNQNNGYGSNFQVDFDSGNQLNNYGQREFQQEVYFLKSIEHLNESIRNSLQQDIFSGGNIQVSRQINEFVINHTEQARGLIQQAIRLVEQSQNNICSPHERQAFQQRENKLIMLAQIKEQVYQLIKQRMNIFGYSNNQQSAHRVMHLTLQAQDLIRDILNQVESHMLGRGIHVDLEDYNFRGNVMLNPQPDFFMQNFEENSQQGIFPSIVGRKTELGNYDFGNKGEDMPLVSKVLVYGKYHK